MFPETCIWPVCQNTIGNVVGNLLGKIFTHISSPIILACKFNNNVDNLKNKVAELNDEKETVEKYAEAVERRGEQIVQKLRNWLTSANSRIEAADDLVAAANDLVADAEGNAKKKCFFGLCLNPKSRYQLSKNAKENSVVIVDLVNEAQGFNLPLSHIPAPPKEVAAPVKDFEDFHSRKDVLERIMEALQNRSNSIIGVHGMAGVGKTMVAKELKRKAEQDNLFDKVVMALVSRNSELKKVQVEIARGLGLDRLPNGITIQDAAERIKERLKKMKKVLIILDDIWVPGIDLEELGIPLRNEPKTNEESSSAEEYPECKILPTEEYAECKILLTSRDSNVLSDQMGSQQNFPLHQLEDKEAWELLQRIVGDRAESDEIHGTAIEIVRQCGCLPLAITTMAKALKNKEPYEWRDALRKLRKPSSENFHGISANVYSAIEVSYSHLESEKLKKTFLLCCLMGQRASIRDLLKYGVGLGLLANTIEEARDQMSTLIGKLRASSLLIDDCESDYFDMHDLIRDVAVSITSRDRHGLLLTGDHVPEEWSDMEAMKDFKWIWLRRANVNELPDEFESPELTFFRLVNKDPSLKIPADFFKGMQRLKVLDLTGMHMSSLPSSISLLKKLHTFCLYHSELGDIRVIGELKNLEILSLVGSDFEELPREIGQLTQLKLLDLSDCTKLKIIPPRVLASMSRLEELYLRNSFHEWEVEENENQRNVSLAELKHLKKLTNLEVCIPNIQMIPKDLFENLKRFNIFIGGEWDNRYSSFGSSRMLKLHLNASISFNYSVKMLLKMTEELHLRELAGVNNVVDELNTEGFRDLKYLSVRNAPEVQHIIKSTEAVLFNAFPSLEVLFLQNLINLKKMFQGRFKETAFNKLRMITVESCDKLSNLFSSSIARQLRQLQEISVTNCSNMEEIVDDEEQGSRNDILEATDQLKFGDVLRSLRLRSLPKLSSLNRSCKHMPLFNEQVEFPNLEELQLSWINVNTIWNASITSSYVKKLTKLIIEECDNLEYLFTSAMARDLVMLGRLEIRECKRMREIIVTKNAEEKENLIFPQLNILLIKDLQNLVGFYLGNCIVEFPSLKQLQISNCPELEGFIVKYSCISDIRTLFNEQVTFPNLQWLVISHLKNLEIIWHNKLYADSFCRLKSLIVDTCEKLSTVFPSTDIRGKIWKSLEKLSIYRCHLLEGIFEIDEFNVKQTLLVIDTKLRELIIAKLPRLKHVWNKDPQGILTFHNLESVNVYHCGSLKILFPASIGKSLLQLQELHLLFCGVEEIVTMGEQGTEAIVNFEFPRVSSLKLKGLPRLQCFYRGKHTTQWPMLKVFYFSQFNQVKITNGSGQLDFPVQLPLFSMEKIFPQLEELSLTRHDIAMASEEQFKQDSFFNIKVLQIREYLDDELDALPIKFLQSFCHLEKLVVRSCNFKELFPSKGEVEEQEKHIEIETFSRIKTLNLEHLPCLKHIWSNDSSSVLQNIESLQVDRCESLISLSTSTGPFWNVVTLNVSGCPAILNLVSISIAQSLVQLERMTVSWCYTLIEIVGNEGDGRQELTMITFTKLRFLTLQRLPRLERFYSGHFTFKFPSLEKVIVNRCPKLKIFSEGDLHTPLLQRVESIEGEDKWHWADDLNRTIQRIYRQKVGFAGLNVLVLSEFPELMEIWHIRIPQEVLDFRQLQVLEICNCSKFRYLLTFSMATSLVQLLELIIKNCGTMEQVILGEGAENQMEFPYLRLINLESCSDLTSFYVGSHSLEIPLLRYFIIKNCPKFITFAATTSFGEHEKEAYQYLFSSKVETPNLRLLSLSSINIQGIWENSIPEISSYVQNLRKLCVEGCGNLKYLLTSSMVKSFEQLNWLEVHDCTMIEEVILAEELVEEERRCKTFFYNMEFLLLQDLPKLTRFCYGNYLELPNLWKLKISKCPVLKTFIFSFIFGDMATISENAENTCTHPLFDTKVAFPKLECLVIEDVKSLNKIWNEQLEVDSFCQLALVSVVSCEKVLNIFPFSMLKRLQRLDKLQIRNCDSLKEIFEPQEPGFSHSQAQKASLLPLLETVTCLEDDVKDVIVFSKLKYLQLCGLPRLSSFCSIKCKFEFPFLEEVILMDCPSMQTFSIDEIRTPKLQKVKLSKGQDKQFWDGNLNSTIQLHFMQKSGGDFEN